MTQEGYKDLDNRFNSLSVGWNAAEREKFWGSRILGIGVVILGAGFFASNYSEYGFLLYWPGGTGHQVDRSRIIHRSLVTHALIVARFAYLRA